MAPLSTPLLGLLAALLLTACGHTPPDPDAGADPEPSTDVTGKSSPRPAADAPRRYTVRRGDTLWDIASRFFEDPWRWPGIWAKNEQVANPHLIFPGDTLVLRDGQLAIERGLPVTRLSPRVREEPLPAAIPAVDPDRLEPFLRHARLVRPDEWARAPRVVATEGERLMVGTPGQRVFVRGGTPAGRLRLAARGQAVTHPGSDRTLAHWLQPVAEGRRVADGDPATVRLNRVRRPVRGGERVLAVTEPEPPRRLRAAPAGADFTVVAIPGRLAHAGTHDTVVLHGEGARRGSIYRLRREGGTTRDPESGEEVVLPGRSIAWAVVYRTDEDLALALLVRAEEAVVAGDRAVAPARGADS
ncbi:LysM domain-containing protein [Thiohalospira halophila DSM 15071]|uniref:LysM domain-containing protein n=1 Tax=Thiohalospira halophila DSM 15071 TaxID=1123397 RepID=A0A1I1RHZ8_9GAMM|nr:LysM domain-containing protein [Thiohalospira halophila]SFD33929.1 LysM domain-containing protein [Thiohalospira halophila DSM 15071]